MTDENFDTALISAAFTLGATQGWAKVSAAAAAREAGLDMVLARQRFAHRGTVLARFGELADAYALTGALTEGPARDRLFDLLLRRFDFLQMHRAGVAALLKGLPLDPLLAAWLARATLGSMGWMLEAAGISASGLPGELRKQGLLAVWGWGARAWLRDESADLTGTMSAVDTALNRAEEMDMRFLQRKAAPVPPVAEDVPFTPAEVAATEPEDEPPSVPEV